MKVNYQVLFVSRIKYLRMLLFNSTFDYSNLMRNSTVDYSNLMRF